MSRTVRRLRRLHPVPQRQPSASCSWVRRRAEPISRRPRRRASAASARHTRIRAGAASRAFRCSQSLRTDTRFRSRMSPSTRAYRFRVNDQNACDENPTGAVTRNVFANDVRLIQNTTTPGNGDEPGFAFTVASERHHQSINRGQHRGQVSTARMGMTKNAGDVLGEHV